MVPHHLCAENGSKEKTATAQRTFYNYNWLKKLTVHETDMEFLFHYLLNSYLFET